MASSTDLDCQVDALLSARGLRRTRAARALLGYLLGHADTSCTHAQLQAAIQARGETVFDRGTLYRLVNRLTRVGLLTCRVDARGMRRYRAAPESAHLSSRFECHSCHRDRSLDDGPAFHALALQKAAQATMRTLLALGCQDLSLDLAVRGVCADCAGTADSARS